MKTTLRLVEKDGTMTFEILDLKYKNKVVGAVNVTKADCKWIVPRLLAFFRN